MDNTNNNNPGNNGQAVDPGQSSIFDQEQTTTMTIDHDSPNYNFGENKDLAQAEPGEVTDEQVPNSTRIKVVAALAIVAVAGYIAYWVQEPVQLRADVISGTDAESNSNLATPDTSSSNSADASSTSSTNKPETQSPAASSSILADAITGESKNIDVSLFGFEPAVLKVDKGTTITWTNTSTEDQTLIGSSNNGQSFVSPVISAGNTFTFKFDQDGTYQYYSTYNPALKASITVGTGTVIDSSASSTTTAATISPPADNSVSASTDNSTTNPADSNNLFGAAPEISSATSSNALNNTNSSEVSALAAATAVSEQGDLKGAAPKSLTKTGPAENLYAVALLTIVWVNRKKLVKIFK